MPSYFYSYIPYRRVVVLRYKTWYNLLHKRQSADTAIKPMALYCTNPAHVCAQSTKEEVWLFSSVNSGRCSVSLQRMLLSPVARWKLVIIKLKAVLASYLQVIDITLIYWAYFEPSVTSKTSQESSPFDLPWLNLQWDASFMPLAGGHLTGSHTHTSFLPLSRHLPAPVAT